MLLSNPFRPDPRVHREALSLVKAGYHVTIICWDRGLSLPREKVIDGIKIIRVGPASDWGNARNMVKNLPKFWKNLRRTADGLDYGIVHAHDLDTLSPGLKLASRKKIPIIYDGHEIYHEMAGENLSPFLVKFVAWYERRMMRKPDIVLTVNEPIAKLFRGYGAKDVREIMNCQSDAGVDPSRVDELRKVMSPGGKGTALYIGVLEPNRLLLELAKAHSAGEEDFILVLGGFGSLEGQLKTIADKSNGRVAFIGKVHPKDVPAYTRAANVLLATYDPKLRNNRIGAPNKLFESMIASRPIIVSKGTYAADVAEKTGCGLPSEYTSDSVLSAVSRLLSDSELYKKCAESGRKAYEEKYNWAVMEARLLEAYSKLLN